MSVVNVFYMRDTEKLFVGRLADKDRKILFEYAPEFIQTKLELSPFKLPLKAAVTVCDDHYVDGLFGVFNDSLPDGWGRLLLDRHLMKLNINPRQLSPLDRLCYVGHHGMGALIYAPEISSPTIRHHENFDEIADEIAAFQEKDDEHFVDDLLALNGSSAGARPKILINVYHEDWIIKFCSSLDPKDIGVIEYIYHLMAKDAGLDVPEAKLFVSKQCPGYFGVQRFDRVDNKRVHMHTLSGLLHVDHRIPSLDYETILKATLWLTKDSRQCEKQFRAAVFNVLSHNRDDHAKNFSFLMNHQGKWQISPAYDLTFSAGPNGEHCSIISGEGKNPTLNHLIKLASVVDIKKEKALTIIEQVKHGIAKWENYAKEFEVSASSRKLISNAINKLIKIC